MKRTVRIVAISALISLAAVLAACNSEGEPTVSVVPTATEVVGAATSLPIIPPDSEVDRKAAMLLGIDLHRQLWSTRPSNNYKFGFQWNVGDYQYQRANVEVHVLKNVVDKVAWADNAVKTDGTEPADFVVPELPDPSEYYSIDGLFKIISEAIENDPARVSLGFDSVFGFPTSAVIEFAPESEHRDISFFAAQLSPIAGPPE